MVGDIISGQVAGGNGDMYQFNRIERPQSPASQMLTGLLDAPTPPSTCADCTSLRCQMSDYRSTEASTLMLKSLRKDFMPNGLFLVRLPLESKLAHHRGNIPKKGLKNRHRGARSVHH